MIKARCYKRIIILKKRLSNKKKSYIFALPNGNKGIRGFKK